MSGPQALEAMYKLPLDFIDRDKLLDLLERVYEAGYKEAGGTLPGELMFNSPGHPGFPTRNPFYDKWLNRKYKLIAKEMEAKS